MITVRGLEDSTTATPNNIGPLIQLTHSAGDRSSEQASNRRAVINMIRLVHIVHPNRVRRNAQCMVNRGCHILRLLRISRRVAADFVGSPNHRTAFYSAAGKPNRLHRSPMVAPRACVVLC